MEGGRVNEGILQEIQRQSEGDDRVSRFLIDLMYWEAEHPFRWREIYTKALEEAVPAGSEDDED